MAPGIVRLGLFPNVVAGIVWFFMNGFNAAWLRPACGVLLLFLATGVAAPVPAAGPQFDIQTWQSDDGAPRLPILSMAQGPDGYLWLASWDMRMRFDGVRFTEFAPERFPELQGFGISKLVADHYGTIWHATAGGGLAQWREGRWQRCLPDLGEGHAVVEVFGEADGSALVVRADRSVVRWSSGTVEIWPSARPWGEPAKLKVCRDKTGTVWFTTDRKKLVRMISSKQATEVGHVKELRGKLWNAVQTDAAGEVWAGTERELAVWRGDRFEPVPAPVGEEPFAVEQIVPAVGQRLWVAANHRLWLWQDGKWVANVCAWPPLGVPATGRLADRNGRLWLGTRGHGLLCANTNGLVVFTAKDGLLGDTISSLYEDRERNIWVGLDRAGLARLRPQRFSVLGPKQGMSVPVVWTVCEDPSGAMWFGTEGGGLNRWEGGRFTRFDVGWENTPGEVRSLFFDAQKTLWVGTAYRGLFHFENGRLTSPLDLKRIGYQVFAMHEDPEGRLWIGNTKGLYRWDRQMDAVKSFGPADGLTNTDVRAIVTDAAGRLWVGTYGGGLARWEGDRFIHCGNSGAPGQANVSGLYADPDGALWLGTIGGGLCCWRNGKLASYTTSRGLPDNRIGSVIGDDLGYLWLGSPAGIFRVSKRALAALELNETNRVDCLAFDKADGLPTRACTGGSQPACWRARDGHLWFTTDGGAVSFDPAAFNINGLPPPVWIEQVLADDKVVADTMGLSPARNAGAKASTTSQSVPAAVGAGQPLNIRPGRTVLEFRYSATSLSASEKVRFKCRLEGIDLDWRDTATRRTAAYYHVPPGDYRFHVIACNNDGVWNETGASLALKVLPYFWQTLWFKGLAAAAATLLVVGAYEIRLARTRGLAQLRLRLGRDLHDEVGSNLGSIALVAQIMDDEAGPAGSPDASEIRRIAKATVESLRDIVWFLDPAYDRMSDLVARMKETANTMLRGVPFEFHEQGAIGASELPLTFRRNALPFYKEALNNIVKHSQATRVEITVAGSAPRFRLDIRDNGVGFDEQQVRQGNGIKNLRRRAAEMGGKFEVRSQPGQGTTVTLHTGIP